MEDPTPSPDDDGIRKVSQATANLTTKSQRFKLFKVTKGWVIKSEKETDKALGYTSGNSSTDANNSNAKYVKMEAKTYDSTNIYQVATLDLEKGHIMYKQITTT